MKRTKLDIINDILKAVQDKGGKIIPTHLLYKSNLSHKRLKLYLNELKERKMMEEKSEKEKKFYELTDNGRKFVQDFRKMKEFTEAFGL